MGVDVAVAQPRLNKMLKKMMESGDLVAGAKTGRSGAGCYKLSEGVKKAVKKEVAAANKTATGKKVAKMSTKGSKSGKKVKKVSFGKKAAAKPKKSSAKPKKVAKKATKAKK